MNEKTTSIGAASAKTFLVVQACGKSGGGTRILDLRREYNPLVKELGFRVLARNPGLAGRPWSLSCRVEGAGTPEASVVLEARLEGEEAGPRLAVVSVPIEHFRWLGQKLAAQFGLSGEFSCEVGVLSEEDPAVVRWRELDQSDDFEFCEDESELVIPAGCERGPVPWPCRAIGPGEGWVRCVFRAAAFREFLSAAKSERSEEKAFLGLGPVYVSPESCSVVIEKVMGPMPAISAGIGHIRTLGRDVAKAYAAAENRVAYLHLHPSAIGGAAMSPYPSTSDHELAWDFDRATGAPCVFPIALFGTDPDEPGQGIAAHGYDRGVLCRVRLEVERDE